MTLEQKIGQLLVVGWQTDNVEDIVNLIRDYNFGNVILFTRNIKDANHLKEMTAKIQEAALKYNGIEAFIAIDQEGGNIRRIYDGVSNIPGHMAIGAASQNNPKAAEIVGSVLGSELKSLGVNYVLAPIVDINTNPQNPIIGIRSFGDNPHQVQQLAEQFSKAIQSVGVLTSYKHFMGHGDVHIDSHLDLPYVTKSLDKLREIELIPYLGEYLPDSIMTAHILFKNVDDCFPASISKRIISDILREEIGYDGLVISDCMEMDALSRAYSLEGSSVFAVQAACDLIIVSHTFGKQMIVRNAIIEAVKNGKISMSLIDQSLARIFRYKKIYCQTKDIDYDLFENQKLVDEISLSSVTIASGELFEIDDNTVVVGVTNYLYSPAEDANFENIDVAKSIGEAFDIPYYSIDSKKFNLNEVQNFTRGKKVILALTDSHLTLVQKVLYTNLSQTNSKIMLISLRTPYDIIGQKPPYCHICLYEYTKLSVSSLIKVLNGEKAQGVLPVKINNSSSPKKQFKNYLMDNIIAYIEE